MEGITDKLDVSREREAWQLAAQHFRKPVFNRTETEQSRILSLISKLRAFEGLPFEQRLAISKIIRFRSLAPNEVLLSTDGRTPIAPGVYEGQQFMVIVDGCAKHVFQSINGRVTRELYKDDTIGMPCVVASIPEGSRYIAVEQTDVVYVDMEQYREHLGFLDRYELSTRIEYFKSKLVVPVLATWTDAQLEELAASVYPLRFQSRTVCLREGEKADSVFFITHGKMKVVREIDFSAAHGEPCAKMLELATLIPGEYFGELAFLRVNVDDNRRQKRKDKDQLARLDDSSEEESEFEQRQLNPNLEPLTRQCTVYAHTPAEVLVLPRLKFIELFHGSALVRVQEYAKGYPSAAEIRMHYQRQQKWSDFKDSVMAQVVTGTNTDAITGAAGAQSTHRSPGAKAGSSKPSNPVHSARRP